MKSLSALLSWLALLVAGAALADTAPMPAGVYHSSELGYALNLPSGWYRIQAIPGLTGESFCNTPDLADGSTYIEVHALPAGTALADKGVVDAVRGDEDEDKFSVVKDSTVKHGGAAARALEGRTLADGDPMYYYVLVLDSRHGLLVLRIEGPPDAMQRADMQQAVQAMLASFKAE